MQDTKTPPAGARTQRIAEIEGLLNAHRQNWTTLDKTEIAALKSEWQTLKKEEAEGKE